MIKGCDVSSAQGKNWAPPAGYDFVYVKATEGTSYVNPYHDVQVARSRDKGLVVGHYAVVREGHTPAQLADYFLTHAKAQPGDFLLCDWEKWKVGNSEIIVPCSTKDAFIKKVQKDSGLMSGLYCNVDAWLHEDTTSFVGDLLAIAWYNSEQPPITHPWQMWQYSNAGGLDKNHGIWQTRARMRDWALGRVPLTRWAPIHGDAAIKAAKAWIGKPYGVGWCQKFTNELFQTGPVGDFDHDNDADAVDGWEAAQAKGKVVPASRIQSMADVPGGVIAYWSGGSHGYGHAAPTIGQGDIVSTDLTGNTYTPGVIGRAPLTAPHDVWGLNFLGYAVVDGNGYTLIDPAASHPKPPAPKPAPAPAPPSTGDWFDMATQKDLEQVFDKYFGDRFPNPSLNDATVKKNPFWSWLTIQSTQTKTLTRILQEIQRISKVFTRDAVPSPSTDPATVKSNPNWFFTSFVKESAKSQQRQEAKLDKIIDLLGQLVASNTEGPKQ